MPTLATLMAQLTPDTWRTGAPFSDDLRAASDQIHGAATDNGRADVLGAWLQQYQPCLFGRIAAQRGLLSYCFVTTADIQQGDKHVLTKIQAARTEWSANAFEGRRSGFVISIISQELERAAPDDFVCDIAKKLTSLYLLIDDVRVDEIYTDTLRLEANLPARPTWEWDVGVNYFSAQGDGRWWHDHRVPVGMALSMNSVGHMVKSTVQAQVAQQLQERLDIPGVDQADSTVDTLGKALKLAMMTIDRAADTACGRATWLLPRAVGAQGACPVPSTKPREQRLL